MLSDMEGVPGTSSHPVPITSQAQPRSRKNRPQPAASPGDGIFEVAGTRPPPPLSSQVKAVPVAKTPTALVTPSVSPPTAVSLPPNLSGQSNLSITQPRDSTDPPTSSGDVLVPQQQQQQEPQPLSESDPLMAPHAADSKKPPKEIRRRGLPPPLPPSLQLGADEEGRRQRVHKPASTSGYSPEIVIRERKGKKPGSAPRKKSSSSLGGTSQKHPSPPQQPALPLCAPQPVQPPQPLQIQAQPAQTQLANVPKTTASLQLTQLQLTSPRVALTSFTPSSNRLMDERLPLFLSTSTTLMREPKLSPSTDGDTTPRVLPNAIVPQALPLPPPLPLPIPPPPAHNFLLSLHFDKAMAALLNTVPTELKLAPSMSDEEEDLRMDDSSEEQARHHEPSPLNLKNPEPRSSEEVGSVPPPGHLQSALVPYDHSGKEIKRRGLPPPPPPQLLLPDWEDGRRTRKLHTNGVHSPSQPGAEQYVYDLATALPSVRSKLASAPGTHSKTPVSPFKTSVLMSPGKKRGRPRKERPGVDGLGLILQASENEDGAEEAVGSALRQSGDVAIPRPLAMAATTFSPTSDRLGALLATALGNDAMGVEDGQGTSSDAISDEAEGERDGEGAGPLSPGGLRAIAAAKRRGRPRKKAPKNVEAMATENYYVADSPTKRGRGRPRKDAPGPSPEEHGGPEWRHDAPRPPLSQQVDEGAASGSTADASRGNSDGSGVEAAQRAPAAQETQENGSLSDDPMTGE